MVAISNSNTYGTPIYPQPQNQPVAPSQTAFIWGDPHINEPDGGSYEIKGTGKFDLLKDTGLSLTADFGLLKSTGNASVMRNADLEVDGKKIHVGADGKTTLDGVELNNNTFTSWGNGDQISKMSNGIISIHTGEYDILLDSQSTTDDAKNKYLIISVTSGEKGVQADGKAPTGLLGETFDADSTQQTAPKQSIDQYRSDRPAPKPNPIPASDSLNALMMQFMQLLLTLMMSLFKQ